MNAEQGIWTRYLDRAPETGPPGPQTVGEVVAPVLVVGANLTVDRTLRLDRLVPGSVMRPDSAVATAGGKAVNVCRAARAHGVRPRLVANLPGALGAVAADWLAAEGHDVRAVRTEGELRSAIIVLEADGRASVLNEPGPMLTSAGRAALVAAATQECPGHRVMVLSGSLPPGPHAARLYAELTEVAHARGVRVVLDAARADLADALAARPDVVVPNLAEALAVLDGVAAPESVDTGLTDPRGSALDAARRLLGAGAGAALVTVGRHGVAGADADGSFWQAAPRVQQVNPIGAGDSFAAGLAVALERGDPLREAARVAVASGAASVTTALAGHVDPATLTALLTALLAEPAVEAAP